MKNQKVSSLIPAILFGLSTLTANGGYANSQEEADQNEPSSGENTITEANSSTVIYGLDFIQAQSGLISVADLVNRIPGGSAMLNTRFNNNSNQRGFGNSNDRILINGKRFSGKSNSSNSTLSRLSVDQVLRVEVIRGSSPDIKVSGSGALINIVLKEDASGSGAWEAFTQIDRYGKFTYRGEVSYTSKVGIMDYNISARLMNFKADNLSHEQTFDGQGILQKTLSETRHENPRNYNTKANLTFNPDNGDVIHLNGLFEIRKDDLPQPGEFLTLDNNGNLTVPGSSFRNITNDDKKYEIGGDYETQLSDSLSLKILALHTHGNFGLVAEEDFEIMDSNIQPDFRFIQDTINTESISRGTLGWDINDAHNNEFGTEVALNKKQSDLQSFILVDDMLEEQDVSASNVTIKETRDESFLNHSWNAAQGLNIDSSIKFEYSKISQEGVGVNRSKTFTFLKPSVDIRYDATKDDQFTVAFRRNISQLNFNDFASRVSDDDQVIGGNENLAPEESWEAEATFEHRLKEDMGFIKVKGFYEKFSNKLFQIETSPGISGVGNAGSAKKYGTTIEGALRFFFLGLPDLRLSSEITLLNSEITDPFTLEKVSFNREQTSLNGSVRLNYDIPKYGISWWAQVNINAAQNYRDIDEILFFHKNKFWITTYIEKQVFGSMVLRFRVENLLDDDFGRTRNFYADGRSGGILTSRVIREQHWSRRYQLSLRGSF